MSGLTMEVLRKMVEQVKALPPMPMRDPVTRWPCCVAEVTTLGA